MIQIGRLFVEACHARDKANDLLDQADSLLYSRLNLPPVLDLMRGRKQSPTTTVRMSELANRLEGSYHEALVKAVEAHIHSTPYGVLRLDDPSFTEEVRPITKFRKRVYVPKNGIPLLSSKQIFQVDPVDVRQLGRKRHAKDMKEIAIRPNMLAITRSGTIGRVQIFPAYMEGWAASEHAIRVIAKDDISAGFLYAWLASDYGYRLITRHSYGSVILEVDKEMISSVLVPNASEEVRQEIGGLVLQANDLRTDAWIKEQEAISKIEKLIDPTEGGIDRVSDRG
jgi:type I restriction enzyme S subunit